MLADLEIKCSCYNIIRDNEDRNIIIFECLC